MNNKVAFTLCSNNYLAQAKTLGDSLTKFHPDYQFVIGLIDKKIPNIDYGFFSPYKILPYDELGYDIFKEMIERYNIVEFNTAVKPFYFDYIFNRLKADFAFYFDPDIYISHSLEFLENKFRNKSILLTPHILSSITTNIFALII